MGGAALAAQGRAVREVVYATALSASIFGEVLVEALSFGFGVAELVLVRWLAVLLVNRLSFVYTVVYDAYKQTHNQEKEIKALSLSSIRR